MSDAVPPPEDNPFAPPPADGVPASPPPAPPGPPAAPSSPPPPPAYGATAPPPAYGAPAAAPYGAPAYQGVPTASVPNNMGLAITSLVLGLCCSGIFGLVTGIIAVVFANGVKAKAAVGDLAGAAENARKARLFALITFAIVAVSIVLGIILIATGALKGSSSTS